MRRILHCSYPEPTYLTTLGRRILKRHTIGYLWAYFESLLSSYSQFFAVVNRIRNLVSAFTSVLGQIIPALKMALSEYTLLDDKKRKLAFLLR